MTAMSAAMPADLAEAVRSMPCGACQAPRGEYCPCDGTHLARWELAVASALVSDRDYRAAAGAARPAPPGFPPGLAVVPELTGVVCAAASHPLRWAADAAPPQWVHLDPLAGPSCACRPIRGLPRRAVPLSPPSLVTGHSGGGGGGHHAGLRAVRPQARPPGAAALTGLPDRASRPQQRPAGCRS